QTALPNRALRADRPAAVDVRLVLVLDRIGAARLAFPGHADAALAVRRATAVLAGRALVGARAAAVDVALGAVLHAIRAARHLADHARADLAHAVRDDLAALPVGAGLGRLRH